ncbi:MULTISPECIES: hypothetical protein [unclassified Psychrobacillus]|uniref:hypothetical protein n=1 Tax=unclassified Psychrobacillus TaxID=2636677 RepID=UPI0030F51BD0
MGIKKSFINGLSMLSEEGTDCVFYFNENMLRDNIMIAFHKHEIDLVQVYHKNNKDSFIFLMDINECIPNILAYRMIKDIYGLYNEHETMDFLNLIEELSLDTESASTKDNHDELFELHDMVTSSFSHAWEEFNNPSAPSDSNAGSVYHFIAKRDKKVD